MSTSLLARVYPSSLIGDLLDTHKCNSQRQRSFPATAGDNKGLLDELNRLESRAEKISLPLSYTDELYALRSNIHLVRKKLQRL